MTGDDGVLVWLTALVPAFLFAYYKGWQGVSVALALGMAVLTSVHLALLALGLSEPDWSLLLGVVIVYVGVCLGLGTLADLLHRDRYEAEQQALTDTLTTLSNRRHATLSLEQAFAAAARGAPLCVALFDLDKFKDFNDRHGHVAGDQVLKLFGKILKGYTRAMDLSASFGGEEFLSVLLDGDEEGALVFAERVRQRLKTSELPFGRITVSCGVAAYGEEMGTEPPRVCRRLHHLRGWGHEKFKSIFNRSTGASGSAGPGSRTGVQLAVGDDPFDLREDRVYSRDVA